MCCTVLGSMPNRAAILRTLSPVLLAGRTAGLSLGCKVMPWLENVADGFNGTASPGRHIIVDYVP